MLGPGVVFAIVSVVYGVPVSLVSAIIPYKRVRTYSIYADSIKFIKAYRFMKRKIQSKEAPEKN